MDTFEAIRTLLATRQFRDTPIPDEVMRQIMEAARLTASSQNAQPWHFIVVREKATLKKLGELIRTGPYIAQAPLAIVAMAKSASIFGISDLSRAVQSMMLAAWSQGVGSNWVGFGHMDGVSDLLAIPADMSVLTVIPFGYPAVERTGNAKKRKPLGEVFSRERYDQPFE
ncbi:MAG TPA: nitroreductase family protein [Ktedonobacterales bacterium]